MDSKPESPDRALSNTIDLDRASKQGEVNLTFDQASKIFLQLSEELGKLEVKYGTASQFVKTKRFQLDILVNFQEVAAKEINELRNGLKMAHVTQEAQTLIIDSLTTGVHTSKILDLMRP